MKIRIENLRDGSNHWIEEIDPKDLDLDTDSFKNPVVVKLDIEKRSGKITVSFSAETKGSFICDRCGENFQMNIVGKCSVMFVQRETQLPDEMPGDDLRSFRPGQTEINISVDIRDTLLLALPFRLLCSENCLGVCPDCGANLNKEKCKCDKQDASTN